MVPKVFMGPATAFEIFSDRSNPNLLGISSPKMIDRKVTRMMMSVVEIVSA